MSKPLKCPHCGAETPAVEGAEPVCTACLLKLGLGDVTDGASRPAGAPAREVPDLGRSIERIGRYRLLRVLGEGGMGIVYLAEQEQPVRRKVALKLIKWGMDTKQVIARFESERQALALMKHPNIAPVLDAGATESGRPYFAMEYVEGVPISEYCDRHRLTARERLGLFLQVCEGVHHAHQKGIIHRDVKPSNILVELQDGRPVPRIIDFGVAKATAQRLTERTLFTELGQLVGTPEYMSPEQAEGTDTDIDTRTDVYSLGVVLYELLVGAHPFDPAQLREAGIDELRRRISEEDPLKPSTRLSSLQGKVSDTAASNRGTEVTKLVRQLRGDLDWITMKALEKDRQRRYPSALELAADVNRYLMHEPVSAGPPSTVYRMRKFARRHRLGVAAGFLLALAAVIAVAGSSVGLVRAREAERQALDEAETVRQVSELFVEMFELSTPGATDGETITAREILDRGAEKVSRELEDQPLVRARLLESIGKAYWRLRLLERGQPLLEESLEIRREVLGQDHLEVAQALHTLGRFHMTTTLQHQNARRLHEQALAIREKLLGPQHPAVADSLALLSVPLMELWDMAAARPLLERALAIRETALGPDDPKVAHSHRDFGFLLRREDPAAALSHFERALEINEKEFGPDSVEVADSLRLLGTSFSSRREYDRALPHYEQALAIHEKLYPSDHHLVAGSLHNVAVTLDDLGEHEEALALLERSHAINEKLWGPEHPIVATSLDNLAILLRKLGDYEEARTLHERALAIRQERLGPDHLVVGTTLINLAGTVDAQGNPEEAVRLYARGLELQERTWGPDHPALASAMRRYAEALRKVGRNVEADRAETRARAIKEQKRAGG